MKNWFKVILAMILLSGGMTLYGQNPQHQALGSEMDAYRRISPGSDLQLFTNIGRKPKRVNDIDREALKPHWAIFDFSDTLNFLVRDEFPEYYLGEIVKKDKKKGLCYRQGNGLLMDVEDGGGASYCLGPWKRDMLHGLVIYRESGSADTMAAEFRYDSVKKKTIRQATPEEVANLDEAIRRLDSLLAALEL